MAKRTVEQQLAAAEARVAQLKERKRKERTRELIQLGAMVEKLGPGLRSLTDSERKIFIARTLKAFDALAGRPIQGGANGPQGQAPHP